MRTTLSTKGQVILPKPVRDRYRWQPGTVFELIEQEGSVVLKPATSLTATTLDEIVGCTGYRGPTRTLEEMDAAVMEEARKQR